MPFSGHSYDPETLKILTRAFNAAWQEVQGRSIGYSEGDLITTRKMMALKIMTAANEGERDHERLKQLAVRAVDSRDFG